MQSRRPHPHQPCLRGACPVHWVPHGTEGRGHWCPAFFLGTLSTGMGDSEGGGDEGEGGGVGGEGMGMEGGGVGGEEVGMKGRVEVGEERRWG